MLIVYVSDIYCSNFINHFFFKQRFLLFHDFPQKSNFLESVAFQHEKYWLGNFSLVLQFLSVNTMISIKNSLNFFWINFLNDFLKSISSMTLFYCQTYKLTCNMWCVMCDMWQLRLDFFVRFWLYESKGDQQFCIWGV